jgi:hypothetical protein
VALFFSVCHNGFFFQHFSFLFNRFFMVSKTDIECVEQAMRAQSMNNSEIANKKKFFWKHKFLRHCRRTTGMLFSAFSFTFFFCFLFF